jgi:hypothetical protein
MKKNDTFGLCKGMKRYSTEYEFPATGRAKQEE